MRLLLRHQQIQTQKVNLKKEIQQLTYQLPPNMLNFLAQKNRQTIDLDSFNKKEKSVEDARKKKRKRISKDPAPSPKPRSSKKSKQQRGAGGQNRNRPNRPAAVPKVEPTEEEVQKQIRETLEKLQGKSNKSKGAKYRRDKRVQHRQKTEEELASSSN